MEHFFSQDQEYPNFEHAAPAGADIGNVGDLTYSRLEMEISLETIDELRRLEDEAAAGSARPFKIETESESKRDNKKKKETEFGSIEKENAEDFQSISIEIFGSQSGAVGVAEKSDVQEETVKSIEQISESMMNRLGSARTSQVKSAAEFEVTRCR